MFFIIAVVIMCEGMMHTRILVPWHAGRSEDRLVELAFSFHIFTWMGLGVIQLRLPAFYKPVTLPAVPLC